MAEEMRLQKYLAMCSVASRRKCEEYIEEGRVTVNGLVATLGTKVDPDIDTVCFDGKNISDVEAKVYIMLNKPAGYISTVHDQFGRKSVMNLLSGVKERVYPVGRLDYDSSGLLLMTNDGDLTFRVTHPSHELFKTYEVTVQGYLNEEKAQMLRDGVVIEDRKTLPAKVEILKDGKGETLVCISIREGRNRQVRKMCQSVGCPVKTLKRISVGEIKLGDLKEGEYRNLTDKELEFLKKI